MQIILLEKVANLGQLGDVVKVKDGFARNFLIPHGKAKRATAQNRAARLDGMMIQVTQKAGVDGKLFGSVTNVDIAEALAKQGFDVPKASIRMPEGPLKTVGDHPLKVALHTDVVVTITVSVLGEQA